MREWRPTVEDVMVLLNELDPYGLERGHPDGAPWDEYGTEARPMARVLFNDGAITKEQVDDIWRNWFYEPLSYVVGVQAAERFASFLNLLVRPAHPIGPAR